MENRKTMELIFQNQAYPVAAKKSKSLLIIGKLPAYQGPCLLHDPDAVSGIPGYVHNYYFNPDTGVSHIDFESPLYPYTLEKKSAVHHQLTLACLCEKILGQEHINWQDARPLKKECFIQYQQSDWDFLERLLSSYQYNHEIKYQNNNFNILIYKAKKPKQIKQVLPVLIASCISLSNQHGEYQIQYEFDKTGPIKSQCCYAPLMTPMISRQSGWHFMLELNTKIYVGSIGSKANKAIILGLYTQDNRVPSSQSLLTNNKSGIKFTDAIKITEKDNSPYFSLDQRQLEFKIQNGSLNIVTNQALQLNAKQGQRLQVDNNLQQKTINKCIFQSDKENIVIDSRSNTMVSQQNQAWKSQSQQLKTKLLTIKTEKNLNITSNNGHIIQTNQRNHSMQAQGKINMISSKFSMLCISSGKSKLEISKEHGISITSNRIKFTANVMKKNEVFT